MRLTVLIRLLPDVWRTRVETFMAMTVILFLALLMEPAYEHTTDQLMITLPALQITDRLAFGRDADRPGADARDRSAAAGAAGEAARPIASCRRWCSRPAAA